MKLVVLCVMLLAFPLFSGYLVEIQKDVSEGKDDKLPNIDDYVGFFFKGMKLLLIVGIFALPPGILLFMSFGASLVGVLTSAATQSLAGVASGVGLGLVGLFVTGIVALVLWIVLPMCVVRYATSGSVGSAFDFGAVLADMGKGPLDYIAILLVWPVTHQLVSWILGIIPMGALLIWPFTVYMLLVLAGLMGQYARLYLVQEDGPPPSGL